jgi:hypothetical protein
VQKGLLSRSTNGRLTVCPQPSVSKSTMNIGFVAPASLSTTNAWEFELRDTLAARGGVLRPIPYVGATDPALFDSLDMDLDGWFFVLPQNLPLLLLQRLRRMRDRIVVLWEDMTPMGIPSIETGPPQFVGKLLDHLASLGHRRVDCLNVQPEASIIGHRIAAWREGLASRGMEGQLHNVTVAHFHTGPVTAREETAKLLRSGQLSAKALFCATTSQAWGAIRACADAGLQVGKDISICGFGEMDIARLLIPTVTCVQPADRRPFLDRGLDWITSRGIDWPHPLRMEPEDVPLFIGESTGPAKPQEAP